jgi:anti-sigma regulatory factor (Ser/Thr protein kinase)
MTADAHRALTVAQSLDARADAPAKARDLVDALELGLDSEQHFGLRAAVVELVTNGVRRCSGRPGDRIDLRINVRERMIRCEVADHGTGSRAGRPKGGDDGLMIVDRIAARWGVRGEGRDVWFELERGG